MICADSGCGGLCRRRLHFAAGRRRGIALGFILGLMAPGLGRAFVDWVYAVRAADARFEDREAAALAPVVHASQEAYAAETAIESARQERLHKGQPLVP